MRLLRLGVLALSLTAIGPAHAQDEEPGGGADAPTKGEPGGLQPDEGESPPTPTETPPPPAAPVPPQPPPPTPVDEVIVAKPATSATPIDVTFGSYGRVSAGSDLRGGSPEKIAVVAHAPRIVEPTYVESDLYVQWTTPRAHIRTVTTIAFDDRLFHYTGQFDAHPALRNLYLEAELHSGLSLWAGSRMYRGDDIYLFDYWPLDDVNTLGGGVRYATDRIDVALHAGTNRLEDPFQVQTRDVAAPDLGAATITVLDRQRLIVTATAAGRADLGPLHTKAKLYLELQELPSGTRRRADDTLETLGADHGFAAGLQLGAWSFAHGHSHANAFVRYASGLSAFNLLEAPQKLDTANTTQGASELTMSLGGAWEAAHVNVEGAAYARRFVANSAAEGRGDGWEYAIDTRPQVEFKRDFLFGVDLSYQARFPQGPSANTLLAADPAVFQLAPMLVYSPMGSGTYARPQLRLVYRAAHLNDAALDLYPVGDVRRDHPWVHFLGVQAEWWFNSSTQGASR